MSSVFKSILFFVLLVSNTCAYTQKTNDAVYSGVPWFDEKGNAVSAHGANIVKENDGKYEIASPFVKKLLLYFMSKEAVIPLLNLPYKNDNLSIDIPLIVGKVIENIDILHLIYGDKKSSNQCLTNGPLGCVEDVYDEEFYRSLKLTLARFPSFQ